jgi:hypothetical protein
MCKSKYICKRCNYTTFYFKDIKKHLSSKNRCNINPNNKDLINYSYDEYLVYSIIPYDKFGNQNIDNEKNIRNIDNYRSELLELLSNIYLNKIKECPYCYVKFNNHRTLKNHIILNCFMNDKNKRNNDLDKNSRDITVNNINISNINNITNIENNYNTIINNITIEIKNPLSFYEDWKMDHIDVERLNNIVLSIRMYSNLLNDILKNNVNHNVIINKDKENDVGLIYKNDIEKFIAMPLDDITNITIDKLYKKLKEHIEYAKEYTDISNKHLDNARIDIIKKYEDYKNMENQKKIANNYFIDIYNNHKDDTIKKYEDLIKQNDKNMFGF